MILISTFTFPDSGANERRLSGLEIKEKLATLFTVIIENSTVIPFRWHSHKYMCFYCGSSFADSGRLKEHHHSEHSDMKIRSTYRSLLRNSKVKLEISQIKCKLCSQEFTKLDPLIDHLRDEHEMKTDVAVRSEVHAYKLDDENMECQECGEKFHFFATMLKHYHAAHNKSEQHVCEICGMSFISKHNVAAHVKKVHYKDASMPCTQCTSNSTCSHINSGSKTTLKCPKCPVILPTSYMKKRHLATVHNVKGEQYDCDQCPKTFSNRSLLLTHKQRTHWKERTFTCQICGYRGFNKHSVNLHMVSHDDARPFECEVCKKAFQRRKTLEFHRRIHTNDKRYVCKICGKAFVQTTSLKLHYRVHHPEEPARDGRTDSRIARNEK